MALFYKCGLRKAIAGLPLLFAIALILYISYNFTYSFLPSEYPGFTFKRLAIQIPFTWFSFMTLVSILKTAMSDPGYLSPDYKHPLTPEKFAPLRQLRVHNMRHFQNQHVYDFS